MSIASRMKSVVVPSANNDAEAAAAIEDRRKAEAHVERLTEERRELEDAASALNRGLGAAAIKASEDGDSRGYENLKTKLLATSADMEVNRFALAEAQQRILDADIRLHNAKKSERVRDMRTKTNRFNKRGAALQEAIKVLHDARLALLETGDQINIVVNGTGLRLGDTGTNQRQIDDLIAEELGRLHAVSGNTFYPPAPGASVRAYYGVRPEERKSLSEEIAQHSEYLVRRVGDGPNPPKAAVSQGHPTTAVAAGDANPPVAPIPMSLNGSALAPKAKGVSVHEAMALQGGIRKQELTFGGEDPVGIYGGSNE